MVVFIFNGCYNGFIGSVFGGVDFFNGGGMVIRLKGQGGGEKFFFVIFCGSGGGVQCMYMCIYFIFFDGNCGICFIFDKFLIF